MKSRLNSEDIVLLKTIIKIYNMRKDIPTLSSLLITLVLMFLTEERSLQELTQEIVDIQQKYDANKNN